MLRKPIKSIILLFIVIVMSGLFLGAMASRSASIYTQDATRQAIRYFDYCSISSRNHDNEEKAEADIK